MQNENGRLVTDENNEQRVEFTLRDLLVIRKMLTYGFTHTMTRDEVAALVDRHIGRYFSEAQVIEAATALKRAELASEIEMNAAIAASTIGATLKRTDWSTDNDRMGVAQ